MKSLKKRFKQFLIDSEKRGSLIGKLGNRLIGRKRARRYRKFVGSEINATAVVFECFKGNKYTDSPRAIYEYMQSREEFRDFKYIWCFRAGVLEQFRFLEENPGTRLVRWGSEEYYEAYATAGYWITNTRLPGAIGKREGQTYVQCWHGTPLKKLGLDITTEATESSEQTRDAIHADVSRYDYLISPSRFCSEKLSSAFDLKSLGKEGIVIETGYPRNDALSTAGPAETQKIREKLGIKPQQKAILYAPTYREDQRSNTGTYEYRDPIDFRRLREVLGGNYAVLFRTHYFIRDHLDLSGLEDFIIDVSDYPEINDLYIAADMLVTDYSSVFFDYGILRRPVVFYMHDLDHYKDTLRGLYLDLSELPGPVVTKQADLENLILTADRWTDTDEWRTGYDAFNERFNYLDDGHAAERAVNMIFQL